MNSYDFLRLYNYIKAAEERKEEAIEQEEVFIPTIKYDSSRDDVEFARRLYIADELRNHVERD